MKLTYLLVIFFLVNISFSQKPGTPRKQLSIIADIDGYTFVRENKCIDSQVIDTIYENEFFYTSQDIKNDWWIVFYNNKEGYVHKGRIQILELMNDPILRTVINNIFITQEELLYQMQQVKYGGKNHDYVYKFLNRYHDTRYRRILELSSNFTIEHKDIELLSKFIDIVSLSTGSADELQASVLSKILYYLPEETIAIVNSKNSDDLNQYLIRAFKFYKIEMDLNDNQYNKIVLKLSEVLE